MNLNVSNDGGTGRFKNALARLRILLWVSYALGIADVLLSPDFRDMLSPVREIMLTLAVLLFTFAAWVNVKILEGRNWARIFYAACMVIWLPPITDWSTFLGLNLYLVIVELALSAWIVFLVFTDPLRQHFAGGSRRPSHDAT